MLARVARANDPAPTCFRVGQEGAHLLASDLSRFVQNDHITVSRWFPRKELTERRCIREPGRCEIQSLLPLRSQNVNGTLGIFQTFEHLHQRKTFAGTRRAAKQGQEVARAKQLTYNPRLIRSKFIARNVLRVKRRMPPHATRGKTHNFLLHSQGFPRRELTRVRLIPNIIPSSAGCLQLLDLKVSAASELQRAPPQLVFSDNGSPFKNMRFPKIQRA